jgi:hypothetical protein
MEKKKMRYLQNLVIIFCGTFFICGDILYAQSVGNPVDLGIRVTSEPPETVKINGSFGISVEVYLEENSSTVPTGDTLTATVSLFDPDNIQISQYQKTFSNGFDFSTDGALSRGFGGYYVPGVIYFHIPWSQASKWSEGARWKVISQVGLQASESNFDNNIVESNFTLAIPDLEATITNVFAVDPQSGELSSNYVPGTNYSVTGVVRNVGEATTQSGVSIPVRARINGASGTLDEQMIVLPAPGSAVDYLNQNDEWNFEIGRLLLPANHSGDFNITLEVNPNDMTGGAIMKESTFNNNSDVRSLALASSTIASGALLEFVDGSYAGENGNFRGLEPIFISFAIRNNGSSPVSLNDNISARILVSEDLIADPGDFIIREFNLGGSGIGNGMLASETINLTWFQQLPDNLEGDYYLLIEVNNNNTTKIYPLDTTPIVTLESESKGTTQLIETTISEEAGVENLINLARGIEQEILQNRSEKAQYPNLGYAYDQVIRQLEEQRDYLIAQISTVGSPAERPETSKNGRFVVFEKRTPSINASDAYQQIYLMDMLQPSPIPKLISRAFGSSGEKLPANGDSFRPKISDDGDTVVFYSRATNLVPSDFNEKEDIFIYRISTKTMIRVVNDKTNEELNGRSLYPDVNGDGTRVVFESDSTNAVTGIIGRQIYLWIREDNGSTLIQNLTSNQPSSIGSGSFMPSISETGDRIVFDSLDSHLVTNDINNLGDVFLVDINGTGVSHPGSLNVKSGLLKIGGENVNTYTYLISLNFLGAQTSSRSNSLNPGHSKNAKISGNGEVVVFESNAPNLVTGTGISNVEVVEPGAGYLGSPKIEINDSALNAQAARGTGAILAFRKDAVNPLGEIAPDGVVVVDAGEGYVDPIISIIPDPNFPQPSLSAQVQANLANKASDVYRVSLPDYFASDPKAIRRVSEFRKSSNNSLDQNGSGGNSASLNPSINWDGTSIVFSTKSSNLLSNQIVRDDGKTFYNSTHGLPTAHALLVGGIGEIEIENPGHGYTSGVLRVDDISGLGYGAVAHYDVDSFGRIISINIINPGSDYNLETTTVSVQNPNGGSGFKAGKVRFSPTIGTGSNRSGGGRIHKIEMSDYGFGFRLGDSDSSTFGELFQFEGDGADLNGDGFPDGRVNPSMVHTIADGNHTTSGRVYLEQQYMVEINFNPIALEATTLKVSDRTNSLDPITIDFYKATTSNPSSTASINLDANTTATEVRDQIIHILKQEFNQNNYLLDENSTNVNEGNRSDVLSESILYSAEAGGNSLKISGLSAVVSTNDVTALKVYPLSNMLIKGEGYTKAIPVINQTPSIFGFSETVTNPDLEINENTGRMSSLLEPDQESDDIYLFTLSTSSSNQLSTNLERVSVSTFGTPVRYLIDPTQSIPSLPSNRFPSISGNGRFVYFTSDSSGKEGLAFYGSNQLPRDLNPSRDLYLRDLKMNEIMEIDATLRLLHPANDSENQFAPNSYIPIVAQLDYDGLVSRVEVVIQQNKVGILDEFGGGNENNFRSNRFTGSYPATQSGEQSLYLVAIYDEDGIEGNEDDEIIATSPLVRFTVTGFEGSLPSTIDMKPPVYSENNGQEEWVDAVTSTSILPLSVSAQDPDGSIDNIKFFADGEVFAIVPRNPQQFKEEQTFSTLLNMNDLNLTADSGILTVFAVAEDSSGNRVGSMIHSISYTMGTAVPNLNFSSRVNGEPLIHGTNSNGINLILSLDSNTGEILDANFSANQVIGNRIFSARVDVVDEGNGTGALIEPIIDYNVSSLNFGKIINFDVINGGKDYNLASTKLIIVPEINAVNQGEDAFVVISSGTLNEPNATRVSRNANIRQNVDESYMSGSGYVIAPELILLPQRSRIRGKSRWPLAEGTGVSSSLQEVEIGWEDIVVDGVGRTESAILRGGFTQSSILFEIDVNQTNELISEVSLIVDGEKVETKYYAPYSFLWTPTVAKDYSINALALDNFGNIASTPVSTISVGDFFGSGVSMNLLGSDETSVEGDGTLLLFAEANSQFGIAEVEYFIDGVSVGIVKADNNGSKFFKAVDMNQFNFSQGKHYIDGIARDKAGNQAGTFSPSLTNIDSRKSKVLNILPPSSMDNDNLYIKMVYPSDMDDNLSIDYFEGTSSGYIRAIDLVDRLGLVSSVQMKVNGEVVSEQNTTSNSVGRFFFSWNNMKPGNHFISFDALDQSGQSVPIKTFEEVNSTLQPNHTLETNGTLKSKVGYSITVLKKDHNIQPPTASIIFPRSGYTVTQKSNILLSTSYSDTDGTIRRIEYLLNGKVIPNSQKILTEGTSNGVYNLRWPLDEDQTLSPGSHSFAALVEDNNGLKSVSNPVTVVVADGNASSPIGTFDLFIPDTTASNGVIRTTDREARQAKAKVARTAKSYDVDSSSNEGNSLNLVGAIISIEITDPGKGYRSAPEVKFTNPGNDAQFIATVDYDTFSSKFGQVTSISPLNENTRGTGYSDGFPDDYYYSFIASYDENGTTTYSSNMMEPPAATEVILEGGHEITEIPIEAVYNGSDGIVEVSILSNGRVLDVNEDGSLDEEDHFKFPPYATSYSFYPGDYDLHILTKDKYNNIRVSDKKSLRVEANKGLIPSVELTYPILSSNSTMNDRQNFESVGSSSSFPIFIDAADEDGTLEQISLFANHRRLGDANRVGNSNKYKVELNNLNLNTGKYIFTVGAIDNEGNFERSDHVPIEIVSTRQQPPEISMISPLVDGDSFSIGSPVSITVQVRQRERPIEKVEFIVDGIVEDTQTEPIFSVGDLLFFTGSWTPDTSRSSIITAVVTDLSGVKVRTGTLEKFIFHQPSVEKILAGELVGGINYDLINTVGNRMATPLVELNAVSGYGSNFQPTAQILSPASGSIWKPKEKIVFNADVGDLDGQSQNLLLQYYTNGGNAMIHFLEPVDDDVTVTIYGWEYILRKQSDNTVRIYDNDGFILKSGIANVAEELARNFRNLLQDEIINEIKYKGTNLAVSFMQDNFFPYSDQGEHESLFQTVYLRLDRFKMQDPIENDTLEISSAEIDIQPELGSVQLETIDLAWSFGKSYQYAWTPKVGGTFVVHAEITDSFSRTTKTMSNHVLVFVGKHSENDLYPADFTGGLSIFPEEYLEQPAPKGSTIVASAEFYDDTNGYSFDDQIESVQFYLNGKPIGSADKSPPFSVSSLLNIKADSWRIDALANRMKKNVDGKLYDTEKVTLFVEGNLTEPEPLPYLALLTPVPNMMTQGYVPGMEISVSASLTGSDSLLRRVSGVDFYIDGEPLSYPIDRSETGTVTRLSEIVYTIKFPLDLDNYDGAKKVSAIGRLQDSIAAIPAAYNSPSGELEIEFDKKYSSNLSQSPAQIFLSLTGENAGIEELNEFFQTDDVSSWAASLMHRPSVTNAINLVAAHHVSIGSFHQTYSEFSTEMLDFTQGLESGDTQWIKRYADFLLSNSKYFKKFPEVPHLVGPYSNRLFENFRLNREQFVSQCINNKYGTSSFQQNYQGSVRLLNHWSKIDSGYWELSGRGTEGTISSGRMDGGIYENGELAVELIYNLVLERLYLGKDPYIFGLQPIRKTKYASHAYAYLLYKDNLPTGFSAESSKLTDITGNSDFFNMPFEDQVEELLLNFRYTSKFNKIWNRSPSIEGAPGWKKEDWFGSLYDVHFPWVYHAKLGWLYLSGTSQRNFWGYSEKLGWIWFSVAAYPHVFSATQNNWIYFDTDGPQDLFRLAKRTYGVYYYSYKFGSWAKL